MKKGVYICGKAEQIIEENQKFKREAIVRVCERQL